MRHVTVKLYVFLFLIFPITIFIFFTPLIASPIEIRQYEGSPPGARSLGLGNTGIALPNEPFSNYYNPGVACFIQNNIIIIDLADKEHNGSVFPGIAGKTINYLSFASRSGGITWRPLMQVNEERDSSYFSDTYQETLFTESQYEYRADEIFLTLTSLSSEMFNTLELKPLFGINLKYYRAYYTEAEVTHTSTLPVDATSNFDSGNGFGVDLGLSFIKNPFVVGFVAKDIFSKTYWSDYEADRIDTKLGLGVSSSLFNRILLTTDYRYNTASEKSSIFTGIETNVYRLEKVLKEKTPGLNTEKSFITSGSHIRLGVRLDDIERSDEIIYSIGFGYFSTRFVVDFALFGSTDDIKEKHFSSQLSFLILY